MAVTLTRVYIGGTEYTEVVQSGTSKHTLGKPFEATVQIPIEDAPDGIGLLLRVENDGLPEPIDHHGRILQVSDNDAEDTGMVEYTSYGPDEIWTARPARDGAAGDQGNLSKPTFITRNGTGPQIMEEILTQSIDDSDPNHGEGDMFIELGSFAGGGADLSGAPTNWPMTIAQIRGILQSSGELDVIVTPIDSGGNIGRVDCFNGDYGDDHGPDGANDIIYQFATGSLNVQLMRRTQDLLNACNKLYYFLGPKLDDQHWRRGITADDPGVIAIDPPYSDIITARAVSRAAIGVRMDIKIFDSFNTEASAAALYWQLWIIEQMLRQKPKEVVHITPVPGEVPQFDIGDIIGVGAGSSFRGGFDTMGMRVYDRTISWDDIGTIQIAEIQTSADQEAA